MIKRALLPGFIVSLLAATPSSAALKRCDVRSVERKLGPTYVTSLQVSHVSCSGGKSLVRAYYKCRKANGGVKGTCRHVRGYTCSERRESIRTQFSAKATCRRGSRRVVHTYTQFT